MAQYEELTIDQGADAAIELQLINADGSTKSIINHTITAKLKKNYADSSGEATSFVTSITNGAQGIATLSLSNTTTDNLKAGRYVYDVELSYLDSDDNTVIERVLEGIITVTPSVTR